MYIKVTSALILTLYLLVSNIRLANAQELHFLKSVSVENIQTISRDVRNFFFIADDKGNLFQFDTIGIEVNRYSSSKPAPISLIESSRTMNIFLFYKDLQEVTILNRFLTPLSSLKLPRELGFVNIVAPSLDNNLWLFDNSAYSLKKYDLSLEKVTLETALNQILRGEIEYNINQVSEYQNKVYLNNLEKEILVFDNLGNYVETLSFKTKYFNFLGDQLYFMEDNNLIYYNLYTTKRKAIALPVATEEVTYFLDLNDRVVLFDKDRFILLLKVRK